MTIMVKWRRYHSCDFGDFSVLDTREEAERLAEKLGKLKHITSVEVIDLDIIWQRTPDGYPDSLGGDT